MPHFFKNMISTIEYEINFKLVCVNKLMAIGNNCAIDKSINVIFRIKITSHDFLIIKLFVLLSTLPQFYETRKEVCFPIFPCLFFFWP